MKPKMFLLSLLSAAVVSAADFVLPVTADWKSYDIVQENIPGAVRLRVKTNKNKFWGHIAHSYPKCVEGQFLQVTLGEMESSTAAPMCGNSSRNGGAFGRRGEDCYHRF